MTLNVAEAQKQLYERLWTITEALPQDQWEEFVELTKDLTTAGPRGLITAVHRWRAEVQPKK